jgi:hypothetical protein
LEHTRHRVFRDSAGPVVGAVAALIRAARPNSVVTATTVSCQPGPLPGFDHRDGSVERAHESREAAVHRTLVGLGIPPIKGDRADAPSIGSCHEFRSVAGGFGDASYNAAVLAASYAQQGRSEEAARTVAMIRRSDLAFDSDAFGTQLQKLTDRVRVRERLRKAGFLTPCWGYTQPLRQQVDA